MVNYRIQTKASLFAEKPRDACRSTAQIVNDSCILFQRKMADRILFHV